MGTKYSSIYQMSKVIKNDPRLSNLDACELNALQFEYLKFAISYFMYDCRKDITNREDPVYMNYVFTADGISDTFALIPVPPIDAKFVVYVDIDGVKKQTEDFDYIKQDNQIKTRFIPAVGSVLYVKSYTVGVFIEDLDIREQNILAEGMNVPFLSNAKNDENALKYIATGKSIRFFSQANHISSMDGTVNNQMYNTVNALISEYSYKGSKDSYRGLAGKGSM